MSDLMKQLYIGAIVLNIVVWIIMPYVFKY